MMNFRAAEKIHANDEVLLKALKYTIKEADIIKFVESEVTRIINKFEK